MSVFTSEVMMIRPKHFGYNEETAQNNTFQAKEDRTKLSILDDAVIEFDNLVFLLRSHDINVTIIEDTDQPIKPDAVFPNNWISFHANNITVTYPMYASTRRAERRDDVIDTIDEKFVIKRRYHFEHYELEDLFLEGTGSMVLDRLNKVCYACVSPRTNLVLLDKFCLLLGYQQLSFTAVDQNDIQIYHTNVMMAMGDGFIIACLESIRDKQEREDFIKTTKDNKLEIIEISYDQLYAYAGNMLLLKNNMGISYLVMSTQAYNSLSDEIIQQIEKFTQIIHSSIPTIEKYGGGSTRCMIAEIFLEKKKLI